MWLLFVYCMYNCKLRFNFRRKDAVIFYSEIVRCLAIPSAGKLARPSYISRPTPAVVQNGMEQEQDENGDPEEIVPSSKIPGIFHTSAY